MVHSALLRCTLLLVVLVPISRAFLPPPFEAVSDTLCRYGARRGNLILSARRSSTTQPRVRSSSRSRRPYGEAGPHVSVTYSTETRYSDGLRPAVGVDGVKTEAPELDKARPRRQRRQGRGLHKLLARDEAFRETCLKGGLALLVLSAATVEPKEAEAAEGVAAPAAQTSEIMRKATRRALGGGVSGAAASILQIFSLMWLRTTMNYQYRYGGTIRGALETLWSQGGIPRFYQGLSFALVQTPLARFGDTASNALVLVLLDTNEVTRELPLPVKTVLGSVAAGMWRLLLFPLDTLKTSLQVQGKEGLAQVKDRVLSEGVGALYSGAIAQAVATFVGHYPYFLTFNFLSDRLPLAPPDDVLLKLCRNAFMGLCSATVSDCCSNSIRVIKTTKQTSTTEISYREALQLVLEKDGVKGLLGRGLKTRLITNGLQGMLFAVAWKYIESIVNAGT